ncbi:MULTISPECIES: hypothetical protein [Roseobacteraceae]|uniref:Uncharacterized protein n=1 Tax=Pseudosulfitobacter pseudonitzschiae TaxID=1402135 RepID=A0A221K5T5_9RHOB|nr:MULTISPECIES: hypothetical protein [Roseobacteraceae]ASM74346.1 hypothetical protein SULPSESMR1_04645 [Pseudosulfitobacter pseudonitzschiae]
MIQDDFFNGKTAEAMAAAETLNTEVDKYADFMGDHKGFWLPDLLVARLALQLRYYQRAAEAAAPMVTALDTPVEHGGAMRVEAMLRLMRDDPQIKYAHPRYWAPFILVGDG